MLRFANINTSLKICTHHDTIIDVELNINTPTNTTTHSNSGTRTKTFISIFMLLQIPTRNSRVILRQNSPANTNHHNIQLILALVLVLLGILMPIFI